MIIENILNKLENYSNDVKVRISDGSYLTSTYSSDTMHCCDTNLSCDYYDVHIGYTKSKDLETVITNVGEFKKLLNEMLSCKKYYIDKSSYARIGGAGLEGHDISDIRLLEDTVYVIYGETTFKEVWNIS